MVFLKRCIRCGGPASPHWLTWRLLGLPIGGDLATQCGACGVADHYTRTANGPTGPRFDVLSEHLVPQIRVSAVVIELN